MFHPPPTDTGEDEGEFQPTATDRQLEARAFSLPNPIEALHRMPTLQGDAVPQYNFEDAWVNTIKVIKLPQPLWREMPEYWFKLDPAIMPFVADLVANPPIDGKYDSIKKRIIDTFSESREGSLRKLLRGQEIADDKPSHFLQRLCNLAGGQCLDSVIRSLFLEQLPENVRGILAISPTEDLSVLALQADRIKPQALVAAVKAENNTSSDTTQNVSMEEQIQQLKLQIQQLSLAKNTRRQQYRGRNQYGRRRSRSRSRDLATQHGIAYYHASGQKQTRSRKTSPAKAG
ncbi:hypothetical protein RF55_17943 [Lasius niger]|uniref:Uncharacterized protein n=1 Tax=Lasius niger TaxID=67767 RepID=A0A0J7K1Y5_LASNI|nr:hypothetical protein RF55_17943 [Lasius niger]